MAVTVSPLLTSVGPAGPAAKGAAAKYYVYLDPGDSLVHAVNNRTGATDYTGSSTGVVMGSLLAAIGAATVTISFSDDTHVFAANVTIPTNVGVEGVKGTLFSINTGVVLTGNGPLHAGAFPLFTGAGTVVFGPGSVDRIRAEWFGVAPSASASVNAAGFAAAVACANASGIPILVGDGTYNVNAGAGTITNPAAGFHGQGQSATIINYTGSGDFLKVQPGGGVVIYQGALSGFQIEGSGAGASAVGIHIADAVGLHLHDVYLHDFTGASAKGLLLENVGQFCERTLGTRVKLENNTTGLHFLVTGTGSINTSFGYTVFPDLELNVNAGQVGVKVTGNGTRRAVLYHGDFGVRANMTGVGTLWQVDATADCRDNRYLFQAETTNAGATAVNVAAGGTMTGEWLPYFDGFTTPVVNGNGASFAPLVRLMSPSAFTNGVQGVFDGGSKANFNGANSAAVIPTIYDNNDGTYASFGFLVGNGTQSPYVSMFDSPGNAEVFYKVAFDGTLAAAVEVGRITREGILQGFTSAPPVVSKTADYTATPSDEFIKGDATAGAFRITLPAANSVPAGKRYTAKKMDSSANGIQFWPAGSDTIDGTAGVTLTKQYQASTVSSNGVNGWDRLLDAYEFDGIRPEWYRVAADTDDTAAWTKAINAANAVTTGQGKVIGLPGKQYVISASLPTVSRNVIVDLNGASISHTATSGSLFTFAGVTSWTPGGLRNGQLVGSSVGTSIGVTIGSGGTASEGVLLEKLDIAGFNDGVSFSGSAGMPFATLLDNCKVHNNNRYGCVFNTGACENLMFVETYVFNNLQGGYVVLGTSNLEIRLVGGGVDGNGDATHPGVYFADGTTVIFTAVNTHFEWPNTGTDPQMIRSDAGATSGSATIELAMGSHGMSVGTVTQPSIQICFGTLTITGGSVSASTLNAALIQLGDGNNKSVTFRMVNSILWCNTFGGTPWFVNTVTTAPIYYYVMGNQCSGLATTPIANWGSNAASWGKTDMDAVIGPTGDLLMTGRLQAQTLNSTGHITATGPAATITPGANAGTSPPAITIKQGGNDICGTVGFGSGTTPGSGEMVQVVFAVPYSSVPMISVTPNNAATGAFYVHPGHRLTTGFTINFETAPPASQGADFYEVNYVVIGVA